MSQGASHCPKSPAVPHNLLPAGRTWWGGGGTEGLQHEGKVPTMRQLMRMRRGGASTFICSDLLGTGGLVCMAQQKSERRFPLEHDDDDDHG